MNLRNKTFLNALALFFVLAIIVLGAYAEENEDGAQESELKTIVVAIEDPLRTMDPHNYRHRETQAVIRNWTDGLMCTMPDNSLFLDLAESITFLDPLTTQVKIREDVYFHNGDHMTADDYVFCLTRTATPGGLEGQDSPRINNVGLMESVEKVDDYTFNIHWGNEGEQAVWGNYYNMDVIPKKYFEEVGVEGFVKHPIGVGPFKWVEGDLNSQVVLERNENYYGGCPELPGEVDRVPALDRVIFRYIAEPTTRVAALLSGEVDIIQHVPIDSVKLIQSNPDTKVLGSEGTSIVHIIFNVNKAPFDDKRVRQAVAYAIDVDMIVENLLMGFATPRNGRPYMSPLQSARMFLGAWDDVQSPYDLHDLEKARELLAEAGYPNGFSTIIDTTAPYSEQAQVIAQMLSDVDIDTTVRLWEPGVLAEEFKKGERDMFLTSRGDSTKSPWGWIGGGLVTDRPALNYGNYSNPKVDELWDTAFNMVGDMFNDPPDLELNEMFIEMFEVIMDDLPVFTLYVPDVIEACRSNVKNFYPHVAGKLNMHKVDIE